VAKHKESKVAALQAMGFKDDKATKMHNFLLWSTVWMQEKEKRSKARKHEHMMDKAGLAMAGQNKNVLLQVVVNEWHLLSTARKLDVNHAERLRLRRLHQQDVRKMMAKALMSDGIMCCHVTFATWHKVIDEKRLRGHGNAMKKDTMKRAGDAMNKAI